MASAQKKVILRRFLGDVLHGYLPASQFVHDGAVVLLDLEGRVTRVPLSETKTICYVRDFNLGDTQNPERLARRTYVARPRGEGLWLRIRFVGEIEDDLEGMASADVSLLNDLALDQGLQLTPPDSRSNTQRIYVPHLAIARLTMLAVITSPSKRRVLAMADRATADAIESEQTNLFSGEVASDPANAKKRSHGSY